MRRHPIKNDIVVIDYPTINAVAICTDMTTDPNIAGIQVSENNPAYRFDYICALGIINHKVVPLDGFIWLTDDEDHMSIVGVNGYRLPQYFYNLDLIDTFKSLGLKVDVQ